MSADLWQWPPLLRQFITYHESIKNHSRKTCDEYYLDLRHFFRYLNLKRGIVPANTPIDSIDIMNVDKDFLAAVTISEVYGFLSYLSRERPTRPNSRNSKLGLSAASRARKVASIRSFFKYLTVKVHILDANPVADLDSPKPVKKLPKFLSLDQCLDLLNNVTGKNIERDRAILTLFIVCGLRISELASLDIHSIQSNSLRVRGKGAKERILYLNDTAVAALEDYISVRSKYQGHGNHALFLSSRGSRISVKTIDSLVKKHLAAIGLFDYSAHKLRHTAATLMLSSGANIRTIQNVLGHEHLNTTEIYTHVVDEDIMKAAQMHPLTKKKVENNG